MHVKTQNRTQNQDSKTNKIGINRPEEFCYRNNGAAGIQSTFEIEKFAWHVPKFEHQ